MSVEAAAAAKDDANIEEEKVGSRPVLHYEDPLEKALRITVALESEMFAYCGNGITNDYRAKARTIIANLKDKNNPDLRVNIFEENIVPEELVRLEPKDLASSALK